MSLRCPGIARARGFFESWHPTQQFDSLDMAQGRMVNNKNALKPRLCRRDTTKKGRATTAPASEAIASTVASYCVFSEHHLFFNPSPLATASTKSSFEQADQQKLPHRDPRMRLDSKPVRNVQCSRSRMINPIFELGDRKKVSIST